MRRSIQTILGVLTAGFLVGCGEPRALDDFLAAIREHEGIRKTFLLPVPVPFRNTFDSSKAKREIGFSNRSYAEGLADTRRLEAQ